MLYLLDQWIEKMREEAQICNVSSEWSRISGGNRAMMYDVLH